MFRLLAFATLATAALASGAVDYALQIKPLLQVHCVKCHGASTQKAGLRVMPVLVRELDDVQVLEIGVIENVQRSNLNPIEEAAAYQQLIEKFKRTQEEVAESIGKSRSHVANTLRLMNLPEAVRAYVLEGKLTAGHARAILTADDPTALAEQIIQRASEPA